MVFKYTENGRDFPSQSVHEKETICNQYEPSRVFGTGIKFLKTRYFEKEEGKQFMRMSWIQRFQTGIYIWLRAMMKRYEIVLTI